MPEQIEQVLQDIIGRLSRVEERLGIDEANFGESDDILVVDDIGQVTEPYPNQIVLVLNDKTSQPGGRLYVYRGTQAGFQPIS